jgi:uridine phosphorylase
MSLPVWQNRDDAIINPVKRKSSKDLGPVAVMVCSGDDLDLLCSLMGFGEKDKSRFYNSSLYFNESDPEGIALIGPFIGAPYAVLLMETLIAWGACKIIVLGLCGALSPDVKIGDLIIPTHAFINDGTSRHYLADNIDLIHCSEKIADQTRSALKKHNLSFHEGSIWTTDAIFRETKEKVAAYQQKGALAVEMETSALFTVGKYRNAEVGGLLVVSDELSTMSWRPGFKQPVFKKSREAACGVISLLCRMF